MSSSDRTRHGDVARAPPRHTMTRGAPLKEESPRAAEQRRNGRGSSVKADHGKFS